MFIKLLNSILSHDWTFAITILMKEENYFFQTLIHPDFDSFNPIINPSKIRSQMPPAVSYKTNK